MPWLLIVGGLVIASLFGTVILEAKHSGALSAQLKESTKIANENAELTKQERAARARADGIAADSQAKLAALQKQHADKRKAIAHAAPSDDGPIAPVLRIALDGLRGPEVTGTAETTRPGRSDVPLSVPGRANTPPR